MMDRLAPNTAALETPNVDGDAMGLFRFVCITRPETESPAPAMTAASTRGMRMFQRMRIWVGLPFFASAAKHSATVMCEEPTNRHTKAAASTASARAATASLLFLALLSVIKFFSGNKKNHESMPK